jgi:hypothetical protein
VNARTRNEFGVLVSLWCGRDHLEVPVEKSKHSFSFGFTSGEVLIDVSNGSISPTNRYRQEFYREKIDRSLKKTKGRRAKGGISLNLGLANFLPGSKAVGEVGASHEANESQTNKNEYWRVLWRVADYGIRTWRDMAQA